MFGHSLNTGHDRGLTFCSNSLITLITRAVGKTRVVKKTKKRRHSGYLVRNLRYELATFRIGTRLHCYSRTNLLFGKSETVTMFVAVSKVQDIKAYKWLGDETMHSLSQH